MGRRRYTADFKRKVVVEAMRGDATVREIAARHGINPNQLSRWRRDRDTHRGGEAIGTPTRDAIRR